MFGDVDDTIAAIASPSGGGLRGLVRVSGPDAIGAIDRICTSDDGPPFASVRTARSLAARIRLDDEWGEAPARVYVWPDGRSYAGQPSAEIHVHGFPALLDQVVETLRRAGVRLAQPGEFTFRAFLAGRIDLVQAEATLGLIDSRGKAEFEVALAQLAGGIALPIREMRERLLVLLADLEAGLDFVDEDIEFLERSTLIAGVRSAREDLEALASRIRLRGASGRTPRIALVGAPNVGKSSLLNALAGSDAAIVSERAGTTRDWVVAPGIADGLHIEFVDTAGLSDDPLDAIDRQAQQATREQAERADVRILCFDATRPPTLAEREAYFARREDDLVVWTKRDAAPEVALPFPGIETSAIEGLAVETLRDAAVARAIDWTSADASVVPATALRGAESLARAIDALLRAEGLASSGGDETLVASELRSSLAALGAVAGVVYTDDLLDRIFSRFCIGK